MTEHTRWHAAGLGTRLEYGVAFYRLPGSELEHLLLAGRSISVPC